MDLRLLRRERGEDAAEPQRVLAQGGAHPVVAGGRAVALVEDQIDDLQHAASRGASSSPDGTANGTCSLASAFFARTIRCATVLSGTRNARAIAGVDRPPSIRSVSATRASVDSAGWQR